MPGLFVVLRGLKLQSEGSRLPHRLLLLPSLMSKHSRARWPITALADVMCTCKAPRGVWPRYINLSALRAPSLLLLITNIHLTSCSKSEKILSCLPVSLSQKAIDKWIMFCFFGLRNISKSLAFCFKTKKA